jgi:hypothetical protein
VLAGRRFLKFDQNDQVFTSKIDKCSFLFEEAAHDLRWGLSTISAHAFFCGANSVSFACPIGTPNNCVMAACSRSASSDMRELKEEASLVREASTHALRRKHAIFFGLFDYAHRARSAV